MAAPPPSAAPILLRTLVRSARELAAAPSLKLLIDGGVVRQTPRSRQIASLQRRLVEALVVEDDDDDKKPAVRDAVELPAIEKKMLEDARDPFEEIEDAEAIRIDFEAESKNDLTCGCGPAGI